MNYVYFFKAISRVIHQRYYGRSDYLFLLFFLEKLLSYLGFIIFKNYLFIFRFGIFKQSIFKFYLLFKKRNFS